MADDDAAIVEVVASVLEDEGHAVVRAYDGGQALDQIARDGLDLLITDQMMPRLTGLELIARMRAEPSLAVPAILMSAAPPAALLPPPTAFLPKPFDLDTLLALVTRLVPTD